MLGTGILSAQQLDQVYVLNQGAFLQGNASITGYVPASDAVEQNVFQQVNDRPLGDIAAHSALMNELLYVLVSNSDKIEIVDPETFEAVQTIFVDDFGGASPVWIEQVSETKAYVSNLSNSTVSVMDLTTNEISGSIEVGPNPEGIAVSNGKAYVAITAFGDGNQVAVIDIETDELLTHIDVHDNPRFVFTDNDGMIWLMATGNYGFGEAPESFGELNVIDPATDQVVATIEVGGKPLGLSLNTTTMTAYVLNEGIQQVDMQELQLIDDKLTETAYFSINYWGGNEPKLYAGFAPDFSSAGRMDILSLEGEVLETFTTGIGPGFVQFIGTGDPVSVEPPQELAHTLTLNQNYPNPFNPSTIISYELSESSNVRLEVYNVQGQRVAILQSGQQSAGAHQLSFDASSLSSGVYYYRLSTPEMALTRSMTLIK